MPSLFKRLSIRHKKEKPATVTIILANNNAIQLDLEDKSDVQFLHNSVVDQLNLPSDGKYFHFQMESSDAKSGVWIDPKHRVLKQLKGTKQIRFLPKYFPLCPQDLQTPFARELFIYHCARESASASLVGCAPQSEVEEQVAKVLEYIQKKDAASDETKTFVRNVLASEDSKLNFLDNIFNHPVYGQTWINVGDHAGKAHQLGLNNTGVYLKETATGAEIGHFTWAALAKLDCHKSRLIIHLYKESGPSAAAAAADSFTFRLPDNDTARHLCAYLEDYRQFAAGDTRDAGTAPKRSDMRRSASMMDRMKKRFRETFRRKSHIQRSESGPSTSRPQQVQAPRSAPVQPQVHTERRGSEERPREDRTPSDTSKQETQAIVESNGDFETNILSDLEEQERYSPVVTGGSSRAVIVQYRVTSHRKQTPPKEDVHLPPVSVNEGPSYEGGGEAMSEEVQETESHSPKQTHLTTDLRLDLSTSNISEQSAESMVLEPPTPRSSQYSSPESPEKPPVGFVNGGFLQPNEEVEEEIIRLDSQQPLHSAVPTIIEPEDIQPGHLVEKEPEVERDHVNIERVITTEIDTGLQGSPAATKTSTDVTVTTNIHKETFEKTAEKDDLSKPAELPTPVCEEILLPKTAFTTNDNIPPRETIYSYKEQSKTVTTVQSTPVSEEIIMPKAVSMAIDNIPPKEVIYSYREDKAEKVTSKTGGSMASEAKTVTVVKTSSREQDSHTDEVKVGSLPPAASTKRGSITIVRETPKKEHHEEGTSKGDATETAQMKTTPTTGIPRPAFDFDSIKPKKKAEEVKVAEKPIATTGIPRRFSQPATSSGEKITFGSGIPRRSSQSSEVHSPPLSPVVEVQTTGIPRISHQTSKEEATSKTTGIPKPAVAVCKEPPPAVLPNPGVEASSRPSGIQPPKTVFSDAKVKTANGSSSEVPINVHVEKTQHEQSKTVHITHDTTDSSPKEGTGIPVRRGTGIPRMSKK